MHYVIALFVIIGLIGAVTLFMDEDHNLFGFSESTNIVKKFKQEEEAFAEFCKGQKERDDAKKVEPVQVQAADAASTPAQPVAAPAPAPVASSNRPFRNTGVSFSRNAFGSTASGVSFNSRPFGNNDFSHLGDYQPSAAARKPQPGPAAQPAASSGNISQAQQLKSSSNPIIKTWASYVSMIEDAEK